MLPSTPGCPAAASVAAAGLSHPAAPSPVGAASAHCLPVPPTLVPGLGQGLNNFLSPLAEKPGMLWWAR